MADHLETPRLSALLDAPGSDPAAAEHLDDCAVCRAEFENMRRTRMALSAMDDLPPPAGQWERIEPELEARGLVAAGGSGEGAEGADGADGRGSREPGGNGGPDLGFGSLFTSRAAWLRAAAAVLIFTGGLLLGNQTTGLLTEGADADRSAVSNRLPVDQPGRLAAAGPAGEDLDYGQWLRQLEALRASGPSPEEALSDPEAAAEHLARLDALIRGARDYVQEMPADTRLNDFLFEVVEDRRALNDALQLASLEYR
ncbi:MAG: hypothetical protein ACOC83_04065 [Gemmatimonadota bacterium]